MNMRVNIQRWRADGVATSSTWQRGPLIQSLASDVTVHPDQRVCMTAPTLRDASLDDIAVTIALLQEGQREAEQLLADLWVSPKQQRERALHVGAAESAPARV